MNSIQKLIKGFKWVSVGAFIKLGLQMGQILILVQFLTKSDLGLYSILMIVIGMSQFFSDLGISTGLVHFQNLTKRQLNTLYWLNIFTGVLVTITLYFGAAFIGVFYENLVIIPLIQWASLVFLIKPFGQQFQYLFQKEMEFSKLAIVEMITEIATFLILVLALINGYGIFSVVIGLIGGAFFYAGLFFFYGRQFHQPQFSNFDIKECAAVIKFGVYQMGERLLNYLNFNLDKIFVGSFFGLATLGAYELAHQLVWRPFGFLSFINGKLTYPFYAKLQNNIKGLNHRFLQNVSVFTFLAYPVYFGLFAVSEAVVVVFFGEGWEITIMAFQIIFLLGVWKSSATLIGAYYLSLGKSKMGFYLTVYQIIVNGLVLIIAGQFLNLREFLFMYVLGVILLMTPVGYWVRWKLTQIAILEYALKLLPNLAISLIMMFFVIGFQELIFVDLIGEMKLIFSLLIGLIIYIILSVVFRIKLISLIQRLIFK